jgi:hypothetical protein
MRLHSVWNGRRVRAFAIYFGLDADGLERPDRRPDGREFFVSGFLLALRLLEGIGEFVEASDGVAEIPADDFDLGQRDFQRGPVGRLRDSGGGAFGRAGLGAVGFSHASEWGQAPVAGFPMVWPGVKFFAGAGLEEIELRRNGGSFLLLALCCAENCARCMDGSNIALDVPVVFGATMSRRPLSACFKTGGPCNSLTANFWRGVHRRRKR